MEIIYILENRISRRWWLNARTQIDIGFIWGKQDVIEKFNNCTARIMQNKRYFIVGSSSSFLRYAIGVVVGRFMYIIVQYQYVERISAEDRRMRQNSYGHVERWNITLPYLCEECCTLQLWNSLMRAFNNSLLLRTSPTPVVRSHSSLPFSYRNLFFFFFLIISSF